ncbi:hypothetical protein Hanom_Chr00s119367g01810991 [Helianthus anomalus]
MLFTNKTYHPGLPRPSNRCLSFAVNFPSNGFVNLLLRMILPGRLHRTFGWLPLRNSFPTVAAPAALSNVPNITTISDFHRFSFTAKTNIITITILSVSL